MAHEIGFKGLFSNGFERSVFNKLETWFLKDGSKVLHNCAIPWKTGKITEADIIMICTCGIFVIECKRWHGIISNDCNRYHKHIPHDGRDDYDADCENPFWQNHLHIECLKKMLKRELGIGDIPFFSLAVFPDECSIENVQARYEKEYPVQITATMIKTIQAIKRTHRQVLGNRKIIEIHDSLKLYEPKTKEERLLHVSKIQQQRIVSYETRSGR